MIRKLQRKFITVAMLSLSVVMLILIILINSINIYKINHEINGTIKFLSENHGQFPKYEHIKPPKDEFKYGFRFDEETPYETRYFIIELNDDGSIRQIDTSHIAAVSSEDAIEYADRILTDGKKSGFEGIYKYEVVEDSYGTMLVFLNCRGQLQSTTFILVLSCFVAVGTLLLVFILVSIFSKKAMKPIIENMEKQKQFITDAGHEIKTPLAIISANADVIELTSGSNEWITSIRNQITRLDKLVKNLLTLSKMDEGNLNIVFQSFDISDAVSEIAQSFEAVAEMQKKNLQIKIQPNIKMVGDKNSMNQLVSTLIDNAMKYSNDNGTIRVSIETKKKRTIIEVYNTVDKIDKKNLDKLFDRFYRSDSSRSRETGGYGIGLSIAKSIVEAHHGKISVKSEDGKSICFTVLI